MPEQIFVHHDRPLVVWVHPQLSGRHNLVNTILENGGVIGVDVDASHVCLTSPSLKKESLFSSPTPMIHASWAVDSIHRHELQPLDQYTIKQHGSNHGSSRNPGSRRKRFSYPRFKYTKEEREAIKKYIASTVAAGGTITTDAWVNFSMKYPSRTASSYANYYNRHPSLNPPSMDEPNLNYPPRVVTVSEDDPPMDIIPQMIIHAASVENPFDPAAWVDFAKDDPNQFSSTAWVAKYKSNPSYHEAAAHMRRHKEMSKGDGPSSVKFDSSSSAHRRSDRIADDSRKTLRNGDLGVVVKAGTTFISSPKASLTKAKTQQSLPAPFHAKSPSHRRRSPKGITSGMAFAKEDSTAHTIIVISDDDNDGADTATHSEKHYTNTERERMKLHLKRNKHGSPYTTWREFHRMFPERSLSEYRSYHHAHPSLDPSLAEEDDSYIETKDINYLDDGVEEIGSSDARLGMPYTAEEIEAMIRHAATLENPRRWRHWATFAKEHPSRRTAAAWGMKFGSDPSYLKQALKLKHELDQSSNHVSENRETTVLPQYLEIQPIKPLMQLHLPELDVPSLTHSLPEAASTSKRTRSLSLGSASPPEKRRRNEEVVNAGVVPPPATSASPAREIAPAVDEKPIILLLIDDIKPIDLQGRALNAEAHPIMDVFEFIYMKGLEPSIEDWQGFAMDHPSKSLEAWLDFFDEKEDIFGAVLDNALPSSSAPSSSTFSRADRAELVKFLLREGHSPRAKAWRAFSKEHEQHTLELWLNLHTVLRAPLQQLTSLSL